MEWRRLFGRQEGNPLTNGDGIDNSIEDPFLPLQTTSSAIPTATEDPKGGQQDSTKGNANVGESEDGNWVVRFNETNFPDDESRIISLGVGDGSKDFHWKIRNGSVIIESVSWKGRKGNSNSDSDIVPQARPDRRRQLTDANSELMSDIDETGATLIYEDFLDDPDLQTYRANRMVLSVAWRLKDSTNRGVSRSGVFTVASQQKDAAKLEDFRELIRTGDAEVLTGNETIERGSGSGTGRGGEESFSSSSAVPSAASSGAIESGADNDDSGGGGGGGGLSTGAIAGIAVAGAVVLLALIGGLVFFCLRRRRRNKDRGSYNNPTPSTTFMAGDKEVHQVTESPHSTYSNDQQVPLSNLAAAGGPSSREVGGADAHHHHHHDDDDAGYAPYRDDDVVAESPSTGRRADGAGTPHGVSRSVAHLVEDGMTEDEIRRLEDEERQLDDAIQRHGRRS